MLLNTPLCDTGRVIPSFELNDSDGNRYRLHDVMGKNGIVIAFICNHCPYVQAIIDRFVADAAILQQEGVHVAAIMSNDYRHYPDDSPARMKAFAETHRMDFPYLVDETQDVARAYGAVCTPDFFGANAAGELHYRGRLDDVKMGDAAQRTPELLHAMRHIAATGKGPENQFPAMGCSIKWR